MSDPILLDASKLSATYVNGSGILQLRGEFTSARPVKDAQFVKQMFGAGLLFEIRGVEIKGALVQISKKIADLDYRITLPGQGSSSKRVVFFTTKSNENLEIPIQFVDAKDQSTIRGGDEKGFQPPETAFVRWLDDATKAVKAKYLNPSLMNVEAEKASGAKPKDPLTFSAYFRVQKTKMVIATGDGSSVSDPSQAYEGYSDITDLKQLKFTPWDLVNSSGIPNIQNYSAFSLVQYLGPPSVSGVPDQPYYEFRDSNRKRIALVGASDGKKYEV